MSLGYPPHFQLAFAPSDVALVDGVCRIAGSDGDLYVLERLPVLALLVEGGGPVGGGPGEGLALQEHRVTRGKPHRLRVQGDGQVKPRVVRGG